MDAPQAPGNYISFFRFVHGDNNRFGQKVWCDILVKAMPVESPQVFPAEPIFSLEQSQIEEPIVQKEVELEFIDVAPENKQEEPVVNELAVSQFEDRDSSSLLEEVKEEVKEEELQAPIKIEENPLKVSQPSQDELERIIYLQKVENLKEKQFAQNLIYILDMGYSNFELNLSLLKRNNNDMIVVINNICNGNVTDSMFV